MNTIRAFSAKLEYLLKNFLKRGRGDVPPLVTRLIHLKNFQNIYTFTYQKTLPHIFLSLDFNNVENLLRILNNQSIIACLPDIFDR